MAKHLKSAGILLISSRSLCPSNRTNRTNSTHCPHLLSAQNFLQHASGAVSVLPDAFFPMLCAFDFCQAAAIGILLENDCDISNSSTMSASCAACVLPVLLLLCIAVVVPCQAANCTGQAFSRPFRGFFHAPHKEEPDLHSPIAVPS